MDYHSYLHHHTDDILHSLQKLIRIPSTEAPGEGGYPYGTAVHRALQCALEIGQSLGLSVSNMDDQVGWCEYGQGDEMIAVLGHLDVVPAGEGWSVPPFEGTIRDGRIYGRGTMDDKGPVVAAIYALAALRQADIPLARRVRVLLGCNEETGCHDMEYYLSHGGETPYMGFTPDGEYPIINGEKGILNCAYTKPLRQTGPYRLRSLQGGTATNVTPAHATAEICCPPEAASLLSGDHITVTPLDTGIQVTAQGVSAHGSTPEQGENAIGRLLLALHSLPLEGDFAELVTFLSTCIGMETRGESLGIAMRDELSGDLTVNLGIAQCDETSATFRFSIRYPVTCSFDDVAPLLRARFQSAGFTETEMEHESALYVPPESELVCALSRVYERETGLKGTPKSIGGGTYAKSMPHLVAFGPVFPGDEVREHKPDEFMEVQRLIQNVHIIAAAMLELAGTRSEK